MVFNSSPEDAFHIFTVPSLLPVASRVLAGENAIAVTSTECALLDHGLRNCAETGGGRIWPISSTRQIRLLPLRKGLFRIDLTGAGLAHCSASLHQAKDHEAKA
jgi:hypothetical protein